MRTVITRRPLVALVLVALAGASLGPAVLPGEAAEPEVVQFSPQGTVKQVRQVTARFSEPMVPLGDLRRAGVGPFEIDCPEVGAERWVDDRTWAYDFARDLPGGVRCRFTLRPGLRALGGAAVGGPGRFEFDSAGARSARAHPGASRLPHRQRRTIPAFYTGPCERSLTHRGARRSLFLVTPL